jgi:hypothetical protein
MSLCLFQTGLEGSVLPMPDVSLTLGKSGAVQYQNVWATHPAVGRGPLPAVYNQPL